VSDQGEVLNELYNNERREPLGWMTVHELCDGVSFTPSYGDVSAALEELQAKELAVRHSDYKDIWHINRRFYADLGEWCDRVLEALDGYPGWLSMPELGTRVRQVTHANVDDDMLITILSHLRETRGDLVVGGFSGVKIRLLEWMKRCQTQPHAL